MQHSPEVEAMWVEYKQTDSVVLRNRLIETYLPLVDDLADRITGRLPRCIEVDEMRSAGVFGLIDAIKGFDLSRDIQFEAYCSQRIRGAILDELRQRDWVPRLVQIRSKKFSETVNNLTKQLGREPYSWEIMEELHLSPEEYERFLQDTHRLEVCSLAAMDTENDDGDKRNIMRTFVDERVTNPLDQLERAEAVREALAELHGQERVVLELYYFDSLTMKEVGKLLHFTESRICQIHGKAIEHLQTVTMA